MKLTILYFALIAIAASANEPGCGSAVLRSERNSLDFKGFQLYQKDALPGQVSKPENFNVRTVLTYSGFLHLRIVTRDIDGELLAPMTGAEAFREVMDHYQSEEIRGIIGLWQFGTNLKKFNELTAAGIEPTAAALLTWTGNQCRKYGFSRAEIGMSAGTPGNYIAVTVLFTPADSKLTFEQVPPRQRSVDFWQENLFQ